MYVDEATIKLIGRITKEYPEIEPLKLKGMIEEVLYEYDLQPMSTALTVTSNIEERIMLYLATKKLDGLSKNTLNSYRLHLVRFTRYIHKNVEDITVMDIRMFLSALSKDNNLRNTTIATEISILRSFFNWLENEEYILRSPMKKIKQIKTEKRLRKALNVEELERLRDACNTPRQRALLEFMFSTGCRLSEISGVNIQDINWNECSLKVIGKGNKERVVYFSQKAKLYIKKYLQNRGDININAALFISERAPHGRLGNRAIEKEISKIAALAGFDKAVFPHLLRHTMATLALQSGAALTTVQKLLGHSDPATTEIYAEINTDMVREEYRKHLIQ